MGNPRWFVGEMNAVLCEKSSAKTSTLSFPFRKLSGVGLGIVDHAILQASVGAFFVLADISVQIIGLGPVFCCCRHLTAQLSFLCYIELHIVYHPPIQWCTFSSQNAFRQVPRLNLQGCRWKWPAIMSVVQSECRSWIHDVLLSSNLGTIMFSISFSPRINQPIFAPRVTKRLCVGVWIIHVAIIFQEQADSSKVGLYRSHCATRDDLATQDCISTSMDVPHHSVWLMRHGLSLSLWILLPYFVVQGHSSQTWPCRTDIERSLGIRMTFFSVIFQWWRRCLLRSQQVITRSVNWNKLHHID